MSRIVWTLCLALTAAPVIAAPPEARTDYFLGTSRVRSAAGRELGAMVSLVKREVKPADGTIVEHVLVIDPRTPANAPLKEFVATLKVNGDAFTMTEASGHFTGEGTLDGPEWAWTHWTSSAKLEGDAGTIKSDDTLTEHGLTVKKAFIKPDGTKTVDIDEEYHRIDEAQYQILRDRLLAAPASSTK